MKETSDIKAIEAKEHICDQTFKLKLIQEIEQGEISTFDACIKYGIKDRSTIMAWLKQKDKLGFKIKPKKDLIELKKDLEKKMIKMEIRLKFFEMENKILKRELELLKNKRSFLIL